MVVLDQGWRALKARAFAAAGRGLRSDWLQCGRAVVAGARRLSAAAARWAQVVMKEEGKAVPRPVIPAYNDMDDDLAA